MGTDLRLSAERRTLDGSWSSVEPTDGSRLYDGCSHPVFAVLANVCNDDDRDGDPYQPIASPRGLPVDVSSDLRSWSDEWGADAHSHSWLSVRELVDYDWKRIIKRRGVVHPHDFAKWDGVNAPPSWCRWVLSSVECDIDNDAMRALVTRAQSVRYPLQDPPVECPPNISTELHEHVRTRYTTIEWSETYATSCRHFLDSTMPKLLALGPADEVRIVFFFDE